jgi:hypothetical protein
VGVPVHERDFLWNLPELLAQLTAHRPLQVIPEPGLTRGGQGHRGRAALARGHLQHLAPEHRVQRPPLGPAQPARCLGRHRRDQVRHEDVDVLFAGQVRVDQAHVRAHLAGAAERGPEEVDPGEVLLLKAVDVLERRQLLTGVEDVP